MKMGLLIAFAIFVVIIGPLASIWSLNILFPALEIPYTFDTWLAAIILAGVFRGTVTKKD
jgi:hypothetical protein